MKSKVKIVVTSPEEVHQGRRAELLLEEYPELAVTHQDFLLLLSVIASDLLVKRGDIKAARDTGKMLSKSDKSLATVQLYLYTKYILRINEFRRIGEVSIDKMASKWAEGEDISDLLLKHQAVLRKIRRRMKALMDVTDKYSVGNIFTGLGLLAEVNQQLGEEGPRIGLQRLSSCSEGREAEWLDDSGQSVEETRYSGGSLVDGDSEASLSSSISKSSTGESRAKSPRVVPRRRLISFHCIADTVAVLTKSYQLRIR